MKDSQRGNNALEMRDKYIKANNERFSTDFPLVNAAS